MAYLSTLNMEEGRSSETSAWVYQTTRCDIPQDSTLHSQDHKKLWRRTEL
jgi:hypothetical protein